MKTSIFSIFLVICSIAFAGCAAQEQPSNEQIPPPTITDASFQLGSPNTVVIKGEFFKIKSDNKSDVVVSLNGRRVWEPAKKITDSSPTSYTADLPYGIDYPQIWVRVYGINGEYSGPYLVQGQK